MGKTQNLIGTLADVMQILNAPERAAGSEPRRLTPRQRALEMAACSLRLAMALGEHNKP